MTIRPDSLTRRTIRSFVRREGRLTPAQQRALDELWPRWGLEYSAETLDLDAVFGRVAPRILEIGFGNGDTLVRDAALAPDCDFLGIEVHRPGVGRLLQQLERNELTNVRVICHDAVEVLDVQIPRLALDGINIFFPDPWPKKRHHKRRLIQPVFVASLARCLKHGGILHVATDWENYSEHILACLEASQDFVAAGNPPAAGPGRAETKFERRGRDLGHRIRDFLYRKK